VVWQSERRRASLAVVTEMRDDDPTTETLRIEQLRRELTERERAQDATTEAEERAAARRADKAAYLREKLDEQAAHADDPA
jgi:hypothetical protein